MLYDKNYTNKCYTALFYITKTNPEATLQFVQQNLQVWVKPFVGS